MPVLFFVFVSGFASDFASDLVSGFVSGFVAGFFSGSAAARYFSTAFAASAAADFPAFTSLSVFMFHGFIRGSIPLALEEAAYIDGCTHTQTFFRIVFPLLKPIISTMVIMNAMAFWNDFLLPSLVLTDKKLLTLPLSTYSFYGTYSADYGTIMAGLLLCVIPILILYVALQKQIINGVVAGAVK